MPKAWFINFKSMQIKERLKYLTILIGHINKADCDCPIIIF